MTRQNPEQTSEGATLRFRGNRENTPLASRACDASRVAGCPAAPAPAIVSTAYGSAVLRIKSAVRTGVLGLDGQLPHLFEAEDLLALAGDDRVSGSRLSGRLPPHLAD